MTTVGIPEDTILKSWQHLSAIMVVGTLFTWVLMPALLRLGEERSAETTDAPDVAPQPAHAVPMQRSET